MKYDETPNSTTLDLGALKSQFHCIHMHPAAPPPTPETRDGSVVVVHVFIPKIACLVHHVAIEDDLV